MTTYPVKVADGYSLPKGQAIFVYEGYVYIVLCNETSTVLYQGLGSGTVWVQIGTFNYKALALANLNDGYVWFVYINSTGNISLGKFDLSTYASSTVSEGGPTTGVVSYEVGGLQVTEDNIGDDIVINIFSGNTILVFYRRYLQYQIARDNEWVIRVVKYTSTWSAAADVASESTIEILSAVPATSKSILIYGEYNPYSELYDHFVRGVEVPTSLTSITEPVSISTFSGDAQYPPVSPGLYSGGHVYLPVHYRRPFPPTYEYHPGVDIITETTFADTLNTSSTELNVTGSTIGWGDNDYVFFSVNSMAGDYPRVVLTPLGSAYNETVIWDTGNSAIPYGITAVKYYSGYSLAINTNGSIYYIWTDCEAVDGPQPISYGIQVSTTFELWEVLNPDIVHLLPVAKRFDQIGPEEFFRYGRILEIEFRILAYGTSIPVNIYYDDGTYVTYTLTTTNGKENSYFLKVPKGNDMQIFRIELGPTLFDFHRYYIRVKVSLTGMDTDLEWVPLGVDLNAE